MLVIEFILVLIKKTSTPQNRTNYSKGASEILKIEKIYGKIIFHSSFFLLMWNNLILKSSNISGMFPVIFPIGTAAAVVAANNLSGGLTGGQSVNHSVVAPSTSIPVTSVVCQTKAQVLGSGGINTQGSTILRTNSNGT